MPFRILSWKRQALQASIVDGVRPRSRRHGLRWHELLVQDSPEVKKREVLFRVALIEFNSPRSHVVKEYQQYIWIGLESIGTFSVTFESSLLSN